MSTFSIELTQDDLKNPARMKEFQTLMDQIQDANNAYIDEVAKELGLNWRQASEIVYVRTRSRYTPELESRMIAAFKAGASTLKTCAGEESEELNKLGY